MVIYCSHSQSLPNVLVQLLCNSPHQSFSAHFVALFILFLLENIHKILHFDIDGHWSLTVENINNMMETSFRRKFVQVVI